MPAQRKSPMTPEERTERARKANEKRWQQDHEGIERHVEQLLKRAPAVTPEQRKRLQVLLIIPPEDAA